jgi:predicted amidohydrolase
MIEAAAITMDGVHESPRRVLPRVCNWVRQAKAAGVRVVFFPELILGHYLEQSISIDGPEVKLLRSLGQELEISIGIGIGEKVGERHYSSYLLIDADGSFSLHRKTRCRASHSPLDLGRVAVTHRIAGVNVGILICSECRFPEVADTVASDGAELLVIPFAYSRLIDPRFDGEKWRDLDEILESEVCRRAQETGLATVAVAASGVYERRGKKGLYRYEFEGGCALIDETGRFMFRKISDGVEMQRFQIVQRAGVLETVLNE